LRQLRTDSARFRDRCIGIVVCGYMRDINEGYNFCDTILPYLNFM